MRKFLQRFGLQKAAEAFQRDLLKGAQIRIIIAETQQRLHSVNQRHQTVGVVQPAKPVFKALFFRRDIGKGFAESRFIPQSGHKTADQRMLLGKTIIA